MKTHSPFPTPPEADAPFVAVLEPSRAAPFLDSDMHSLESDHGTDLDPTEPRFDADIAGRLEPERPTEKKPGPRQRKFTFDALVIRDTVVMKLRSVGREDKALTLDNCHREAIYKRCVGCAKVKTFYNRCENFYCPICAARLARDRRESVAWWAKVVGQPKHLVLTVTSVPRLTKAYVRKLKDDFRKLRSQKWCKNGETWQIEPEAGREVRPGGLMRGRRLNSREIRDWKGEPVFASSSKWIGGFWSLDATFHRDIEEGHTYTSNGTTLVADAPVQRGWHVHFHIIVDCAFVDQDRLSKEWAKIRGQEISVVRVYNVKGKDYTAEACKYVCDGVQLASWPAEKLAEFCDALSQERCFDTFGKLYLQRAEWTAVKEEILKDRQVCECGCSQYQVFDANEWEWQQAKSSLSPPPCQPAARPTAAPELWPASKFLPVFA